MRTANWWWCGKVERPTLAALDMSKVDIVLPAIKAGLLPTKAALKDVQTLSARELRANPTYSSTKALPKAGEEPAVADADVLGAPTRESEAEPDRSGRLLQRLTRARQALTLADPSDPEAMLERVADAKRTLALARAEGDLRAVMEESRDAAALAQWLVEVQRLAKECKDLAAEREIDAERGLGKVLLEGDGAGAA